MPITRATRSGRVHRSSSQQLAQSPALQPLRCGKSAASCMMPKANPSLAPPSAFLADGTTVTDINGFYMIDVPTNARNISYQSMGMVAENIAVSNSVMNVATGPCYGEARGSVRRLFLRWHCC